MSELKPHEVELVELLRRAKPFDTIEIVVASDGRKWSVVHRRQEKRVLTLHLQTKQGYAIIEPT